MIGMDQIESLSRQIAEEFRPQRIVLFGSYAYGEPTHDSDVDLLVVLPFSGRPVRKAIEIRSRVRPKIPVDLMVRTPDQLADRIEQGDWFMREIVEKGRTLYEADHARMD
jgi:predicted nucleotidyltransferase